MDSFSDPSSHPIQSTLDSERQCWRRVRAGATIGSLALLLFFVFGWHATQDSSVDPVTGGVVMHSFRYFVLCLVGGILSGVSHVIITPIDLVKCRMQVGDYASMTEGLRRIYVEDARGSLARALPLMYHGWVPALFGYCIQGGLKYALYELIKHVLQAHTMSGTAQVFTFLLSGMLAEFIADFGLAPFEAMKVKMQTVSFVSSKLSVLIPRIYVAEGWDGFYKGLIPLWCRQVPSTMMKFASFEKIVRILNVLLLGVESGGSHGSGTQLCISLLAGIMAGVLCCLVSHPADTLISKLNQRGKRVSDTMPIIAATVVEEEEVEVVAMPGPHRVSPEEQNPAASPPLDAPGKVNYRKGQLADTTAGGSNCGSSFRNTPQPVATSSLSATLALISELGWKGLWRGLGPRLIMICFLTAMQWVIYDSFRVAVGLPTTGGSAAKVAPK